MSRKQIRAAIWLNNAPIPQELCEREPEIAFYGFYRRINTGEIEFVSFCNPEAADWLAMHKDDFADLLNAGTAPRFQLEESDFSPLIK